MARRHERSQLAQVLRSKASLQAAGNKNLIKAPRKGGKGLKGVNTMIIALVEYINRYGKISMKSFTKQAELDKFIAKLDNKGTEYIVTPM